MKFEDFWNKYASEDIVTIGDEILEVFKGELPEEIYQEYDLGEIVAEFVGHHETAKQFGKIQELARILKENNPRLYDENHVYINDALVNYYCFRKDLEALQEPVQDFIAYSLDYDMLLVSFKKLVYYNYLDLANTIIEKKYQEVKQDEGLLSGAEYDLAMVKYFMLLEDFCGTANGEISPMAWQQLQQASQPYDFELKDDHLQTITSALTEDAGKYASHLQKKFIKGKSRNKAIAVLEIMFLQKMRQKKMSFPVSGTIWAGLHEFWEDNPPTNWKSYFRITEAKFKEYLGGRSDFLLDYRFDIALVLWGSSYVLDFLHDIGLIDPESYETQKAVVETIKQGFMKDYRYSLWEYDFVHDWVPAQKITPEAWQQEQAEFVDSFELKPENRDWNNVDKPYFSGPSLWDEPLIAEPAPMGPKIGRNEKVSVKYPDGTVKEGVKYKKVADDLEAGRCELT